MSRRIVERCQATLRYGSDGMVALGQGKREKLHVVETAAFACQSLTVAARPPAELGRAG